MTSNYATLYDPEFQRVETPNYLNGSTFRRIDYLRHSYLFSIAILFFTWKTGYNLLTRNPNGWIGSRMTQNKPLLYLTSYSFASLIQQGFYHSSVNE
jgi:hypothetical protein